MSKLVNWAQTHPHFAKILSKFRNLFQKNRHVASITYQIATLKHCSCQNGGEDNLVVLKNFTTLDHVHFIFKGSHNRVVIGAHCHLHNASVDLEDDNCLLTIGDHCTFGPGLEIGVVEGTHITIGNDCMFSSNVLLMATDAHGIWDLNSHRINPSKGIEIGSHVWVGTRVMILKGTSIGKGCILGAGSIATKPYPEENCIMAGSPAKIIKTGIKWSHERNKID